MSPKNELQTLAADLRAEIAQSNERLKELRRERDEALSLVTEMREHLEDVRAIRESWCEAFLMVETEPGLWTWNERDLWEGYDNLLDRHNALVRDWNRMVGTYNAVVQPRPPGRPLAASEAQISDVLKRRKAGASLRAIAGATGLALSTVRSILSRKARDANLRKREFDKHRAVSFRARKRLYDGLPKRVAAEIKDRDRLIKAAKGLDTVR